MCHIFYCITLFLDLVQRLVTYFFACFIFVVVYAALTAALISGMTYGYKFFLAEYYTINSTLHSIRKISLEDYGGQLVEFDAKNYKILKDYYKELNSSQVQLVKRKSLRPYLAVIPPDTTTEKERATLAPIEDEPIERATVEPTNDDDDEESLEDHYVKKLNWVSAETTSTEKFKRMFDETSTESKTKKLNWVWDKSTSIESKTGTFPKEASSVKFTDHARYFLPAAKKIFEKISSASVNDYLDNKENVPLRNLVSINKVATTTPIATPMQHFMNKLKSALVMKDNFRRTAEPYMKRPGAILQTDRKDRILGMIGKGLTASNANIANTETNKPTTEESRSLRPLRTTINEERSNQVVSHNDGNVYPYKIATQETTPDSSRPNTLNTKKSKFNWASTHKHFGSKDIEEKVLMVK